MMNNNSDTDIDLIKLFIHAFDFIKRRKWIFIFFIVSGLSYGILNNFKNPLKYKSYYRKDFFVKSSFLDAESLSEMLEGSPEILAKDDERIDGKNASRGLSRLFISKIKSLKPKLVPGVYPEKSKLNISIEAYEKQDIDSIVAGITTYFLSLDYLKNSYELFKQQNLQLLEITKSQIANIDSENFHNQNLLGKNSSVIIVKSTSKIDLIDLIEKKHNFENNLLKEKIIEFIEINPSSQFVNNSTILLLSILGYGFFGFIFGAFFSIVFIFYSKFKNADKIN